MNIITEGFHLEYLHVTFMQDRPSPLETSCGFILLNFDSFLLLQYPQGHWSFPKGHVEKGDTDHHSTASRELTEETGITDITIDAEWTQKTEYTFSEKEGRPQKRSSGIWQRQMSWR